MHRHPILYPIVTVDKSPEIQVSDLRTLPYRDNESDTATLAASSKYVVSEHYASGPPPYGSGLKDYQLAEEPSLTPPLFLFLSLVPSSHFVPDCFIR